MKAFYEKEVKKAQYIYDAVQEAIKKDLSESTAVITKSELKFYGDVLSDVEFRLSLEKEGFEKHSEGEE